jgi:glycosyltransferase involved in cell wall biosynthesis
MDKSAKGRLLFWMTTLMKKKPRLTIFSESFYPAVHFGGPIFSILGLINDVKDIYDVRVFTSDIDNEKTKKTLDTEEIIRASTEFDYPVTFHHSYFGRLRIAPQLKLDFIKSYNASDLIYIQGFFNWFLWLAAILSIFKKNRTIVVAPRGSLGEWSLQQKSWKKFLFIKIVKYTLPTLNFHLTSVDERKDVEMLCCTWNCFLCPNQVAFDITDNTDFAIKHQVISVGRHEPQKGFDRLIKSFCEFEKIGSGLKLVIIGVEGSETDRLQSLARGSKNIVFEKPMDRQKLQSFMKTSLALISTSRYENYGNTILEALSCGALVIMPKHLPWEDASAFTYRYDTRTEKLSEILKKLEDISSWHADNLSLQVNFVETIKAQTKKDALLMLGKVRRS